MQRRSITLAAVLLPATALPQTPAAVNRVGVLTDLVTAIGAAGEAISKLTAGFRELADAGKDSYQYVAAARERDRLMNISRGVTDLVISQSTTVVQSLDEYLAHDKRDLSSWLEVVSHIERTLVKVHAVLEDVKKEDGSFILEPAYFSLRETLTARSTLLEKLGTVAPPHSKSEITLLRQASAQYKRLINNAKTAVGELNRYIKGKK